MPSNESLPSGCLIAIIGMGCLFPKASSLKSYWCLLLKGIDAITEVPPTHWTASDYYNKNPKTPDHVYCTRGGFLPPIVFDPFEFGIPPNILEATDTSQLLGLLVAKAALQDAGYFADKPFDRDRTSVILGVTGTQELVIPLSARLGHPLWRRALNEMGIMPEKAEAVVGRISDAYVPWQENSFPGLLGNVIAGRISNRLDLGGTNCAVDAACASSLSAIHMAALELQSGRSDMVLSGGIDTLNDIFMHMCFAKTQVLSTSGDVRPFSKDADGTVLGEGLGLLVLKRLIDAERDQDRIYAVIKGIGSSSDGKSQSIYAPRRAGQEKALRAAYREADVDPATVGLVEAHGTGTRVGDQVEFDALKRIIAGSNRKCSKIALGSVKSMIGHTKAAAGAAGMIKSILAVYHKVLPPTLKADQPDPQLNIDDSPFYLNGRSRPWMKIQDQPRRAGVSAFGFGGSNFHIVLEEHSSAKLEIAWDGSVDILAVSGSDIPELMARLQKIADELTQQPEAGPSLAQKSRASFNLQAKCRLLMVINQAKGLAEGLKQALHALESERDPQLADGSGLFLGKGTPPGKLAFVFPGQGSQYADMGREWMCIFPAALVALEKADAFLAGDRHLSDLIYPPTLSSLDAANMALRQTEIAQPAIAAVSLAMLETLRDFGVRPDVTCGHSFGELTALHAAGWIDTDSFLRLAVLRGRLMAGASAGKADPGGMLAVQAPLAKLEALIGSQLPQIVLANRNGPEQGVLSGSLAAIQEAEATCGQAGFKCVRLPVAAAFHNPLMASVVEPFRQALDQKVVAPSEIPVFANTSANAYPREARQAVELLARQLITPVDFITEIQNMYDFGVRTFVEVGPKSILSALVRAILPDRAIDAIPMDSLSPASALAALAQTLCRLAAGGYTVDLNRWEPNIASPHKPRMRIVLQGANYRASRREDNQPVATPKSSGSKSLPGHKDPPLALSTPDTILARTSEHPAVRSQNYEENTMKKDTKPIPDNLEGALAVVQEGLRSMQSLQEQTARAHQKFLESQTEASRALQAMMESIQRLAESALGLSPARPERAAIPTASSENGSFNAPQPTVRSEQWHQLDATDIKANAAAVPAEREDLVSTLLEVVSELTGYPQEMVGLDMDFEADLGIDSIKRVEILSSLEEKLPGLPPVAPEMLGSFRTLEQIVSYLITGTPTAGDFTQPIRRPQKDNTERKRQVEENSIPATSELFAPTSPEALPPRYTVVPVQAPPITGYALKLAADRKICITDDSTGLSQTIADELIRRGLNTELVPLDVRNIKNKLKPACGLIIVFNPKSADANSDTRSAFNLTRLLGPDLNAAGAEGSAIFASVTRLDGAFGLRRIGFENPQQGGLAGLVKTAAIEWPDVCCHAVDVDSQWKDKAAAARTIVDTLLRSGPVEIGLRKGECITLDLVPAPYPEGEIALGNGDIVIISGGARGITATFAIALASHTRSTMILLGRSDMQTDEPSWLKGLEDEKSIKAAILEHEFADQQLSPKQLEKRFQERMAAREIAATLDRLRATTPQVQYFQVDVRDAQALRKVIKTVRNQYGQVSALIHGAGILEDKLIIDKDLTQFDAVYDTKVKGLENLLQSLEADALKYLVVFSSITARLGNIGQSDYAMANEALNKMAQREALRRPDCRVLAVNWGPWEGGMVTPALKREFTRRGVRLIPPAEGARSLVREMGQTDNQIVEVIIGDLVNTTANHAAINQSAKGKYTVPVAQDYSLAFEAEIDLESYPILKSHIIGGKPVVPLALMVEWFCHSALHENPGLMVHGLDDLRILKGIRFESEKQLVRLLASKINRHAEGYRVDVELRNGYHDGNDVPHCRAMAILAENLNLPPSVEPGPVIPENGYHRSAEDIYARILFHGHQLQGIRSIIGCSPSGMIARVASAPPPADWIKSPLRNSWITDPLILDSAFQIASLWCYEQHQRVSLPSYVASYRQYRQNFPQDGCTVILTVTNTTHQKMRGDFTFLDAQQAVFARLTGFEAVMDDSLNRAFKVESCL